MKKAKAFYGHEESQFVISLFKLILPMIMNFSLGGMKVKISDYDLSVLKNLKSKRTLLLPNHPNSDDPYVIMELAKRLGENFNAVIAREVFDWDDGLRGKIFQKLGGYSLIRGFPDRQSFKTTQELLIAGKQRLVIFIEGEITYQNESLFPFEEGVIAMAFKAFEKLDQKLDDFYICPLAIKYKHENKEKNIKAIENSISSLERALGLIKEGESKFNRIVKIMEKILGVHESWLSIKSVNEAPEELFTKRAERIKDKLLSKIENFLDLQAVQNNDNNGEFKLERIRRIRNHIDKITYAYTDDSELSQYEKDYLMRSFNALKSFYKDLEKLVNFYILEEGYLTETCESPEEIERYIQMLSRLEREVFGERKIRPPATAELKVGEVINLKDFYVRADEEKPNKKIISKQIAFMLEKNMKELLGLT